ncbi:MAG: VCBS repeat-containing protein [Actinobacteria bacterium]|nr:VCBS repeat-containing protein [Actinomycetota bacterium]
MRSKIAVIICLITGLLILSESALLGLGAVNDSVRPDRVVIGGSSFSIKGSYSPTNIKGITDRVAAGNYAPWSGDLDAYDNPVAVYSLINVLANMTGRLFIQVDPTMKAEISVYAPSDLQRPITLAYTRFGTALVTFRAREAGNYMLVLRAQKGYGKFTVQTYTVAIGAGSLASDVNLDGTSDAVALYNYGNSSTGLWTFISRYDWQGPFFTPLPAWLSGPVTFDPFRESTILGDFNGDGRADVLSLYGYGGTTSAFWLWRGTANGYTNPEMVFFSTGWEQGRTKLVSGDFDQDGRDEVVAFYLYSGTTTGAFFFDTAADGALIYPRQVFFSEFWDWGRTMLATLGPNEANTVSIVAMYGYSGSTAIWRFMPTRDMIFFVPKKIVDLTDIVYEKSKIFTGDINGDWSSEVLIATGDGDTTAIHSFAGVDKGEASRSQVWGSTAWTISRSTFLSGDFNSDGIADVTIFYNYGDGKMAAWLLPSMVGVFPSDPQLLYYSPYWDNNQARWLRRQQ